MLVLLINIQWTTKSVETLNNKFRFSSVLAPTRAVAPPPDQNPSQPLQHPFPSSLSRLIRKKSLSGERSIFLFYVKHYVPFQSVKRLMFDLPTCLAFCMLLKHVCVSQCLRCRPENKRLFKIIFFVANEKAQVQGLMQMS